MTTQFPNRVKLEAAAVLGGALGLLERERILTRLLWNATGLVDFTEADGRRVHYRLPGKANGGVRSITFDKNDGNAARTAPIVLDDIAFTEVDIAIDSHLYKGTSITDEQLTLDVTDFTAEVSQPLIDVLLQGFEAKALTGLRAAAALAANRLTYNPNSTHDNLYPTLLKGRKLLRQAPGTKLIVCGSDVEEAILLDAKVSNATAAPAGSATSAIQEATLSTKVAGFTVVGVPYLDADEAYALVPTAVALTNLAPIVPDGATFGAVETYEGVSMRVLRDYDPNFLRDRIIYSMFAGAQPVIDGEAADAGFSVRVVPFTFGTGTSGTVTPHA